MKGRLSGDIKKLVLGLLTFISLGNYSYSFQQEDISGIINTTDASVVTIGIDRVTVSDVTGFNAGDTVLLIQMQGVRILTGLADYGSVQNKFGEPGMYEFLIIQSVTVATNEIVFRNIILNTYDPKGNIQIIKVPYYNSANVTGVLTCNPWSSTSRTGGVLALIVGRTLKLSADIDVTGKGFEGGMDTIGQGICRALNESLYGLKSYPRTFLNAGFKGEGIAIHDEFGTLLAPVHVKGAGANFTGGGGGNGKYSGGGGGSNRHAASP